MLKLGIYIFPGNNLLSFFAPPIPFKTEEAIKEVIDSFFDNPNIITTVRLCIAIQLYLVIFALTQIIIFAYD